MANRRYTSQFSYSQETQPVKLMSVFTQESTGAKATLTDQDVTYLANLYGEAGNDITVELIDAQVELQPLVISVDQKAISVILENDAGDNAVLVNQGITYLADDAGDAGNDITIELTDPAAPGEALDIVVTDEAISVSLATSAGVAATSSLATTAPITLTSVATGSARNTTTFHTVVNAPAGNPGATILFDFTGTAAAIICTITPNDGTFNALTPVTVTSANLRELITTGLVTAKTPTITDASSLRILQTATGGNTAVMAAGGEGDNLTATFSGGITAGAITTTATILVAALNLDMDASALIDASGSGSAALTVLSPTPLAGGGDNIGVLTDADALVAALNLNTAVTALISASGSGSAPLAELSPTNLEDGEDTGFSQIDSFAGMTLVQLDDGLYEIQLENTYAALMAPSIKLQRATAVDLFPQMASSDPLANSITFRMLAGATPTNLTDADVLIIGLTMRNSANSSGSPI